ncbi:MAG: TonB-dependent receptor plug domain-containing protein [Bacteroidota bacterium]
MKKLFSLPFFMLFGVINANAQNLKLEGKVITSSGVGVEGAYVTSSQNEGHTHTDALGRFFLNNVQKGDTLTVTHIAYNSEQLVINEGGVLKIRLEEKITALENVVISTEIKTLNQLSNVDLDLNPVQSSQYVLRKVPGLIIGQHAGGGKAEQIFLRGFDIDHGTDINITVDGMPVNMVSHAHGQGYSDLHFVIPELIEAVDFGKGPYYADKGNFTTAGYVDFKTRDRLEQSSLSLEYGRFNTLRTTGLFKLLGDVENSDAFLAVEYQTTDGPFESSQNFNRINLTGKYSTLINDSEKLSVSVSHFNSKWDASGQIPQRAVDAGLISRFGAIDDTEGGSTDRTNIQFNHFKSLDEYTFLKSRAFFSNYNFELFSNFTFFLNDPVNGDQIRQREQRNLYGFESSWNHETSLLPWNTFVTAGVGFRYDDVNDVELSRTRNRRNTISNVALGDVDESNFYGFFNAEFETGKWLINPSVRLDYFKFDYVNDLDSAFSTQSRDEFIASPKLNVVFNPNRNIQFFAKTGFGFHSNDTRVVTGEEAEDILPKAIGADLGTVYKLSPKLVVNAALWYLFLEQEFVYVGDEGIVEPSGETRRVGIDLGLHYQLSGKLFFDADVNLANPRSIEEPEGADRIPLAPTFTTTGGLSYQNSKGFSGSLKYRYIQDRPANEDNSIVAEGYFITDLNLNYALDKTTFSLIIENLFDTEWNETQFATESRLFNETESVEEIHFTPGSPFFVKGKITFNF